MPGSRLVTRLREALPSRDALPFREALGWRRLRLHTARDLVGGSGRRAVATLAGLGLAVILGSATLWWIRAGPLSDTPSASASVRALPSLPALPASFQGVTLETYLEAWVPLEERDALLRSPVLRDPDFARRVHWWIDYWTGPAAAWFPGFLERMAWLGAGVDSALAAHDLPPSLRYLPLIESGYAPAVASRASAVGLWQLMAPTARGLGLEVSPLVDERRHMRRSTEAALTYLGSLQREFGSWHIALAAYNTGPTRVRRILRRHAPDAPLTDSLFWALRHRFAPETRDFLPKLYSAMWVASRPEAYGFEAPEGEPLAFDTVVVSGQATLDVVARAAGTTHAEVLRLNPHVVRGITPPDRSATLLVPAGHADDFALHFPLVPPEARATFVQHVVSPGETLSRIAVRYGVRTGDIQAANPEVEPARLPVGARLTVPVAPGPY